MTKLIYLYCTICQSNDIRFRGKLQHSSNNKSAQFTDMELITVYLWGKETGLSTQRAIHNFTKTYLHEWFPKLPSYQAFCRRLNRLAGAFAALAEIWMEEKLAIMSQPADCYIVDSCSVMAAKGSRSNRAKPGIQNTSHVHSLNGLLAHSFFCLAFAAFSNLFNY